MNFSPTVTTCPKGIESRSHGFRRRGMNRQVNHECRALICLAGHGDIAAQNRLYDVIADTQSQTVAAQSEPGSKERVKYFPQIFPCNAVAVIGKFNDDTVSCAEHAGNIDASVAASVKSVQEAVLYQIHHHLTQWPWKTVHHHIFGNLQPGLNAGQVELVAHRRHDVVDQLLQVEMASLRRRLVD